MALLYSDEKSVIDREIKVENLQNLSKNDLVDIFELDKCVSWISEHQLSRICLQFPDNLLQYSVDIAQHLEKKSCKQIYILGDTSYGSCCVDEVAASHVNADGIIHFGHSCLSTLSKLPVLYIFSKQHMNTEKFLNAISHLDRQSQVIVLYDTCYANYFDDTMFLNLQQLSTTMSHLIANSSPSSVDTEDPNVTKLGRQYYVDKDNLPVIYVYVCDSKQCRNLDNFVMSVSDATFYQFNPDTDTLSPVPPSSIIKKHLFLIEKVRDAQTVGILIGTLAAGQYLTAVNHVKSLCKKHAKKSYIISVGKPNVPKLANFPEIDVYVLISCPEMSLPNAKEFLQPIVHLIDVELALNPDRQWDNRINLEFSQLLLGGSEHIPCPDTVSSSMDISLLSNNVRVNGINPDSPEVEDCTSLAVRGKTTMAVITGREGLTGRSWQGLEPNLGLTPVSSVTEGRTGTPSSGYTSVESNERS
uniref:2-(3-amino-3-carboxypropyl)histidine synthase subunit 2 n=1 Tax=Cacopsylla melanoneura TaxID=428564 RepID=A0A8D9BDH5_9HEMI